MKNVLKFTLMATTFCGTLFSCSDDDSQAVIVVPQPLVLEYSNGPISTGTTTSSGTNAPVNYSWSELQLSNTTTGYTATQNTGFMLADDFTVPEGETWNISKISFLMYQTDFNGIDIPLASLSFKIIDRSPKLSGATDLFGDLSQNYAFSGESAKIYRINNESQGYQIGTNREVFRVSSEIPELALASGTYWIIWWSKNATNTLHYYPAVTIKDAMGPPDPNALQFNPGFQLWENVVDGEDTQQDFPFELSGSITKQ